MSSSVLLCSFYRTKSRIHRAHHPTVSAVTRHIEVALSTAPGPSRPWPAGLHKDPTGGRRAIGIALRPQHFFWPIWPFPLLY